MLNLIRNFLIFIGHPVYVILTSPVKIIRSHNYTHTGHNPPGNLLEWSLFCSDELTGLITACALVQPSKKLSDVTLESVLKKFSQKSFAAGAKREDIQMCEQKLNIPLPDFVKIVLLAMQSIAPELGL
jgi:predicted hydrolase (HD superfamily)